MNATRADNQPAPPVSAPVAPAAPTPGGFRASDAPSDTTRPAPGAVAGPAVSTRPSDRSDEPPTRVVTGIAPPPVVGLRETGKLRLVDGKIGEINGRSVLAQEFLEDFRLVGILRQEAIRLINEQPSVERARVEWRRTAAANIAAALNELIEDELVYRERLTQVEGGGAGIRRVLNNVREILRRQSYGSLVTAEAWVRQQGGAQSVEQFADDLNRDQIIRFELDERVKKRVAVSWREVENYYRRNLDRYAPPPRATIRLIQTNEANAASIASRLQGGEPFADAATDPANRFRPRDAGLYRGGEVEFTPPFETHTFIAQPEVNRALTALSPGEWAGPIEAFGGVYFVFLESIADDSVSLYDAQLEIENAIRDRKTDRETQRYISSLLEASSITRRELMARRLADYAERALFDPIAGAD